MKKSLNTLTLLIVLAFAGYANAAIERFNVNMFDAHYKKSNTLKLKQILKQNYPRLNLQKAKLVKVKLIAKSKRRQGTATLYTANRSQDRVQIDVGGRRNFRSNDPYTYGKFVLNNYTSNAKGAWQIDLGGNIKIKRMVLVLDVKRRGHNGPGRPGKPGRGGRYVELGSHKADKFKNDVKTFVVNLKGVKEIALEGMRSTTDINYVEVTFGNGQTKDIRRLEGTLHRGDVFIAKINNRNIRRIKVGATSPGLFGPSGVVKVLAKVSRR